MCRKRGAGSPEHDACFMWGFVLFEFGLEYLRTADRGFLEGFTKSMDDVPQ